MKIAVRWRPDIYRSTMETVIIPGNAGATPPTSASRVKVLQVVAYDDTKLGITGNPYVAGSPASEQYIAVVVEAVIELAVTAFAGLTDAQAQALWDNAKQTQITAWENQVDIQSYIQAAVGGYLSPLVVFG